MPLTDRGIHALKPIGKDQFIADGGGLYLRLQVSGAKTFLFRSRRGGAARWTTIGPYPRISLAKARQRTAELADTRLPENTTVQAAYDAWLALIRRAYKSHVQVKYRMDKHILPKFGKRNVGTITRAEISAVLTKIATTAPVQANRVLTDVKLLFAYAVERGWIDDSPAQLITQKTVGGKEPSRSRFLSEGEIVQLIDVLRTDRFEPPTRWALLWLLLTGQRSGEVRGMVKSEVPGSTWQIPAQRTKNSVAQTVYLNPATSSLLDRMLTELGSSPFGAMEGQTLSHACRRMKFDPPFTPHDLRRTMATHMSELGVAPHIVEKCLNHKLGGVMAIYNRAEYATEKRAAWRLWTRYLLRLRKKAPDTGG